MPCHARGKGETMWCTRRVPAREEEKGMRQSDEGMCADGYHLVFRRNSGLGRGARCRYRPCDQGIVGPALRRRPVFRRRLSE